MSVLDEFRSLEQRVVTRLRELQPLIAEYEELQQIADRFGFDVGEPPAPTTRRRGATRRNGTKRSPNGTKRSPSRRATATRARTSSRSAARRQPGGTKAVGAARRERVLELIGDQPGITVPEISRDLGVEPPPVYRVVRKLQADGLVEKEGKSLRRS